MPKPRDQRARLKIAYATQNVGLNLAAEVGDVIPVKYTISGLQRAGHRVTWLALRGRSILAMEDIEHPDRVLAAPAGLAGRKSFLFAESAWRRLQQALGLPYLAFFDSYRFYEACRRSLPDYDLCHEHNALLSVGAALACWQKRVPYVLTVSADPILELGVLGRPLRGLQAMVAAREARLTYRLAKRVICVSDPARRHLVERWRVDPKKIVVMPNGVDAELFGRPQNGAAVRARLRLHDSPVVAFVGGLQPWHGVDKLVAAFARVLARHRDAKLLLVGDGPARIRLDEQIAALGIGDAVVRTGAVPHAQVPELLAAADVAVVPYPRLPHELWFSPLKLYEYMAAGKAIVASRAGQIAEVLQDGRTGLLVEPGDVDGFAEAIDVLLREPDKRIQLGENARRQAVEHHSWDRYVRRLEELYRDVLSESMPEDV